MAQKPRLGGEPEQRLKDGERQELGIGDPRCQPDPRTPLAQLGAHTKCVADRHVQGGDKGVQVGVHETSRSKGLSNADHGRLVASDADPRSGGISWNQGSKVLGAVIAGHAEAEKRGKL